ncbi:hypothetical protein HZA56_02595 [Candidatus Poribacteria bacterium]|nr:hypothetical protein [Candidatus Poribacteria bacterium]
MRTAKGEYSVRLELEKYDFPDVPPESCHLDLSVNPGEEVKDGDLCYAPCLNQVMWSKKKALKIPLHKIVSVTCPSELAVKRLPDLLFVKGVFNYSTDGWRDRYAS